MLRPLGSLSAPERVLARLQSKEHIPLDELHRICGESHRQTGILRVRQAAIEYALREPTNTEKLLDATAWTIAIAAFLVAVFDYFNSPDGLSLWGWIGLWIGVAGLFVSTMVWQLNAWELDDHEAELSEIIRWRRVLTDISSEAERRVDLMSWEIRQAEIEQERQAKGGTSLPHNDDPPPRS